MKHLFKLPRWVAFTLFGVMAFGASTALPTYTEAASVTPETLPTARVATPYSVVLSLTEATSTSLMWNISNGSLPPDLTLEPLTGGQSARIQGRATTAGTYTFRLQLMNGMQVVHEQPYSLIVWGRNGAESDSIVLPTAKVGTPFTYTFPLIDGNASFNWTIISGTLPSGLSLNPAGIITGTPTATSSASFTVQAVDNIGRVTTYPLTLNVNPSALLITTDMLPTGTIGTSYNSLLTSTGGLASYDWTLSSGILPAGLTLDSNGRIQGTPTVAGIYPLTFTLRDAEGVTTNRTLTLTVNPASNPTTGLTPVITTTSFIPGTVGTWYSSNLGATGGYTPYQWRVVSGNLPAGLTIGTNGAVTGVPTTPGIYSFTLEAMDAQNQRVSLPYQVVIQPNTTANLAEQESRLQMLRTLGINVHSLVKLPDDRNSATQEDSAVYYIGADGRRHAFPHERVFFTWYGNFLNVQIVSASTLASIPLGSNVTYKPGTRMIKFPNDTRVYAVSGNRVLHWIPTEAMAQSIYGTNWNQRIDDVVSAYMNDYTFGAELRFSSDYNPSTTQSSVNYISETLPTI